MDINTAGLNTIKASLPTSGGGDVSAQISALRQKLQYLTSERQKAKQAQNTEKAKKLDQQIQQIREMILKLERKRSSSSDIAEKANNSDESSKRGLASLLKGSTNKEPGLGRFIDMFV